MKKFFPNSISNWAFALIELILFIIILLLIDWITKKFIRVLFKSLVKKTKTHWDDILYEKGVFDTIAHTTPLIFAYLLAPFFFEEYPFILKNLENIFYVLFTILIAVIIIRFFSALSIIATTENKHQTIAVQSFTELIKIITFLTAGIIVLSVVLGIEIQTILGSLGVASAVIILVFKDTILGFVSGIQIAISKSIKVGDWITVPKHAVDGNIIQINLVTAKVRNFDQTITTIPTYDLISSSVKNWESLKQISARRIKRSLFIDAKSLKFCDKELIERLKKFDLLKDYLEKSEIENKKITNIGTFRYFANEYLINHPKIDQSKSLLVRYLDPSPYGIPFELYCFTNDNEWVNYENIQSDIFDYLMVVIKEFDLETFQNPSGFNLVQIKSDENG